MVITPAVLGTASECLTSQLPNVSETVAFRAVGNKTLLVDLGDDSQCVLNGMGSKIWKSVCKRESPAQTVAALQKDYDLDQETLEAEYRDFLAELKQAGYVT